MPAHWIALCDENGYDFSEATVNFEFPDPILFAYRQCLASVVHYLHYHGL